MQMGVFCGNNGVLIRHTHNIWFHREAQNPSFEMLPIAKVRAIVMIHGK